MKMRTTIIALEALIINGIHRPETSLVSAGVLILTIDKIPENAMGMS